MRLVRSSVAAVLALAAAGCGLTASPADGLRFQAPAGWRPSPGIMGFMQFWRPPDDDREMLMLFKSPRPVSTGDVFSNSQVHDTLHDMTIQRRQTILICGRQPATYIDARGRSSRGGDEHVEMMMTNVAGSSYFAMYVRPIDAAPNPTAQAALRELCAKP
jgi:hypothetical protein